MRTTMAALALRPDGVPRVWVVSHLTIPTNERVPWNKTPTGRHDLTLHENQAAGDID
jgi:hypothetical protein